MPYPAERALPTTDRAGGDGSGPPPRFPPGARSPLWHRAGARWGHRDSDLPPKTRRIVHLDVDAFLASVEQALHPELAGLPVVIGGMPTERNLVMSCSYAARAFGVRPGMLLGEAARLCPQAIFRRGDSAKANRMREAIAMILARFTPKVEVASIDDFFADLTGTTRLLGAACDVAERMRASIVSELTLPVTIGIGSNKTMARLAGKVAKPGGIAEILPGHERAFLATLPVEHLPGAGHAIGRMLERFAIRTTGELALVSREVLYASFGHYGLVLHERARGIDHEPVEATYVLHADGSSTMRVPRSIRRDSTFEPEEGRREIVEAMLCYLVERAAHRLRSHHVVARALTVRIVYVDTRSDDPGSAVERRRKLDPPTDSTDAIWQRARALLRELPRRRALVKRVGLTLSGFAAAAGWQNHLFDEQGAEKSLAQPAHRSTALTRGGALTRADRQRRIDVALDRLRDKHGFGRVLRGTSFTLCARAALLSDGFRLRTPSLNQ